MINALPCGRWNNSRVQGEDLIFPDSADLTPRCHEMLNWLQVVILFRPRHSLFPLVGGHWHSCIAFPGILNKCGKVGMSWSGTKYTIKQWPYSMQYTCVIQQTWWSFFARGIQRLAMMIMNHGSCLLLHPCYLSQRTITTFPTKTRCCAHSTRQDKSSITGCAGPEESKS